MGIFVNKPEEKEDLACDPTPVGTSDVQDMNTFQRSTRYSDTSPQDLSELWFTSNGQAAQTLKTAQNLICSAPLSYQECTEQT